MARGCRFDCSAVVLVIRILAALTNLGVGVGAGYLIYIAHLEYTSQQTVGCAFVENTRLGVFHGVIGLWFCLFSILGFLAEVRVRALRRTVLAPFGFLLLYIGRGITYMILGCIFCSLPISKSDEVVTLVPGAVYVTVGILEIIIGVFIVKGENTAETVQRSTTTRTTKSTARWGDAGAEVVDVVPAVAEPSSASSAAGWGSPTKTKLLEKEPKSSSASADGAAASGSSPTKSKLLDKETAKSGGAAVVSGNPFRSAGAAASSSKS